MIFANTVVCGRRRKEPASCPLEISLSQTTREGKVRVEGGNLLYFLCPSAEETQLSSSETPSHSNVCLTSNVHA